MGNEGKESLEWKIWPCCFSGGRLPDSQAWALCIQEITFPGNSILPWIGYSVFLPLPLFSFWGFPALVLRRQRLEKILASHMLCILFCERWDWMFLHVVAVCACRAAYFLLLLGDGTGAVKSSVNSFTEYLSQCHEITASFLLCCSSVWNTCRGGGFGEKRIKYTAQKHAPFL